MTRRLSFRSMHPDICTCKLSGSRTILVILNLFQDLFLKAIDSGLRRNDEETGIKYLEYTKLASSFCHWNLTPLFVRVRMQALIWCGILLFLAPSSLHAAEFSGKYLLHICSSDKAGNELIAGGHTACQAYIAGIIDYHNLIKSLKTAPGLDFCIPKDTPLSLIQQGLVLYLLKNGQHDDFIASPAVAIALNQMYPCRKKKK